MRSSAPRTTLVLSAALGLALLGDAAVSGQNAPLEQSAATAQAPASDLRTRPHGGSYHPHERLRPDQLTRAALQHRAEGRPQQALEELERALALYPDEADLLAVRGSLYLEQADYSKALRDLEAALRIQPNRTGTLVNRAQAYRQFGRIAEALADLDRAVEVDPQSVPALFNRGSIHFSSGEYAPALADFERCIAIDPHQPAPYFNRAATYDALGRREEAIADLQRFIELSDNEQWRTTARGLAEQWTSDSPAAASEKP